VVVCAARKQLLGLGWSANSCRRCTALHSERTRLSSALNPSIESAEVQHAGHRFGSQFCLKRNVTTHKYDVLDNIHIPCRPMQIWAIDRRCIWSSKERANICAGLAESLQNNSLQSLPKHYITAACAPAKRRHIIIHFCNRPLDSAVGGEDHDFRVVPRRQRSLTAMTEAIGSRTHGIAAPVGST
jgi:hypothetical protein